MGWLIAIIIVGGLVWFFNSAATNGRAIASLRESFMATHESWDVFLSPHDHKVLAIDQESRRVALGDPTTPIEVTWSQITSVEIERNGQTLAQTNRGSQAMGAAVGGLLLGPAGLLLGGLSGSKRSVDTVNELCIKVIVDNQSQPVHRIEFVRLPGKGLKPDSSLLKPLVEQMERFHALLSNAMRSAAELKQSEVRQISIDESAEARIAKLWDLKQAGALTDDEYASAKAMLLSNDPSPTQPKLA